MVTHKMPQDALTVMQVLVIKLESPSYYVVYIPELIKDIVFHAG